MRFITRKIALLLILLTGVYTSVCAQNSDTTQMQSSLPKFNIVPRVAGLEKNAEYMALLVKEHTLQIKEDSAQTLVDKTRKEFQLNPLERSKYGSEILRLEGEIFDIRNEIGLLESKINSIEQEFVISNLDSYMKVPSQQPVVKEEQTAIEHANFVYNDYLKENLPERDYSTLLKVQNRENSVVNYIKIYTNNYSTMEHIESTYQKIEKAETADSLYRKFKLLGALNDKISDSISTIWTEIFDNKSYAYSYLFDKMNERVILADYENGVAKLRQQKGASKDQYASDILATYPISKKLMLNYEIKLSDILGLSKSRDSLKMALAKIDSTNLALPKIMITERTFIDYQDIVIASRSPYSSIKPIPHCIVYPRGTVYRVLLGSYTKAQVPSIFRGVSPIGYLISPEKRYNYYAGAYPSLDLAKIGVEKLIGVGFKRPEIVVWENGVQSNLSSTETSSVKTSASTLYRIEIQSTKSDLPELIKEIVAANAKGVDISRIINSSTSEFEYTFIIGTFDSNSIATKLANTLTEQQLNEINITVNKIEN